MNHGLPDTPPRQWVDWEWAFNMRFAKHSHYALSKYTLYCKIEISHFNPKRNGKSLVKPHFY
ncbi:hypothetical protein GCM10022265_28230 [Marinobacter xestospongiae]